MTQTEKLKDSWVSTLLMFRQGQASLEVTLEMLALMCKGAKLTFPDGSEIELG